MFNENIPNINAYNSRMEKSILDKALFMSHIDADIIVDYGCANGALIKFLKMLFPEKQFIGFDISEEMIALASKNCPNDAFFTTNWHDVILAIAEYKKKKPNSKTCICLSSVIHEVYAYGNDKSIEQFWRNVFDNEFDYIVMRDMYVPEMACSIPYFSEDGTAAWNCVNKIFSTHKAKWLDYAKVYTKGNIDKVSFLAWQKANNDIYFLIHFLLKYFYEENWQRELMENYHDRRVQPKIELMSRVFKYEKIFDIKYTLPYIKMKVKEDFGYDLRVPTHFQYILKRNK